MTTIYIKIRPGSDGFRIENGTIPEIHVEAEPENGRANTELLNRLEDVLGEKPGIISGHKSRRKQLKVNLPEDRIREKLGGYNG